MALRIRRGPTADRTSVPFLEGELVYDTDLHEVFIGDGTTAGGLPVTSYTDNNAKDTVGAMLETGPHSDISFSYDAENRTISATVSLDGVGISNVVEDTTPQLGGNLDLNTSDITGTGNINITGSVTATELSGPLNGNVTGNVVGYISSSDLSTIILNNGTDGTDATFTGTVTGDVDGNLIGAVKSGNGITTVLDNGTDGTDATFTGSVTGPIITASISAPEADPIGVGSDIDFNFNASVSGTLTTNIITTSNVVDVTVGDGTEYNYEPTALSIKANAQNTLTSGPKISFAVESVAEGYFNPAEIIGYRDTDDLGVLEFRTRAINNGTMDPVLSLSTENGVQSLTVLVAAAGFNLPESVDNIPTTSAGAEGDYAGAVRVGDIGGTKYLFYCIADWADATPDPQPDIWVRVALSSTTW